MPDKRITIEVNGIELEARPGQMLMEVTDRAGIYIPRFCYHEKLSVPRIAACAWSRSKMQASRCRLARRRLWME